MGTKQLLYVIVGMTLLLLLGIVYSYSMFRLEIEETLSVNTFESGIPYMIALFFFSFFMAIGGNLFSRYQTLPVALFGVVLLSIGFILSSFVSTIFMLTITYGVLVGIGVGILYGLPLRVVAQLDYKNIGFLTGIVLLGFGLSPLVFAPLINTLILFFGLSQTFLLLGLSYFVVITPLVVILSKRDELEKSKQRFPFTILKNKQFISLYILFFIGTFIGLTFIGFTGNIGKALLLLDESTIALFIGIFALFNGLGRPIFGYIHDTQGFKRSARLLYTVIICASLVHYFIFDNLVLFIITFSLFYLNFGGWLSLAPATTIELFGKKEYSKNFGIMYTAYGFGALFGNAISGMIVETIGLRSIFLLMSFIALIGLIVLEGTFKEYQKE